ncbi:MAG: DASS family sodium-coupled anion symporter [Polyangiales bacterium]
MPPDGSLIALEPDREPEHDLARDAESEEVSSHRWLGLCGAIGAPAVFLLLWFAPLPLSTPAHRLAAIAGAVLIAWVTEVVPLPVSALALGPLLVMTGVSPAKKAFASFADPILFLFVGSFFVARAMQRHGLDRRIAEGIASLPIVAGRPARIRAAVGLSAMALSMWMSNTGTTAILLPVLLGMISGARGPMAAGSVLMLAHASTTGGLATIVGTPPNAITARILAGAGIKISFLDWMKVGVPAALVLTGCAYALLAWTLPAGTQQHASVQREGRSWSRAELITGLSFVLMVAGWIVPDALALAGVHNELATRLEPGAVAIAASSILFMVPARPGGERVLTWADAVKIEWGLILLFGGGIALGEAMFETGLAGVLGEGFLAVTHVEGLWSLTAAALALAVVLTEFCSNTAAANMLLPLVIGAAVQLHVSPIPPALAVGFGASCGFMLPVATGANAIAYGTQLVSARSMIRVGFAMDVISGLIIFAVLRTLCPLLGWD